VNRLQRALDALVERIDTPAPIVLVDVMQDNIDRMQGFAAQHDLDVRPHVKTHKCVEIGRRQVEAGAVGITAGNVGEAEVFAAAGFDDIFLAYPIWPAGTKGTRIRRLAETTRLRVGVDNVAAVEALADAMGGEPDRLQVVVEVDCGARRSGASAAWCRWASSRIRVTAAPGGTRASAPRRTSRPRSPPRCAASPTSGSPQRWSAPAPHPLSSSPPTA
jgi:D-serine deaminase-like pyridoxal phosphate-dependent protein